MPWHRSISDRRWMFQVAALLGTLWLAGRPLHVHAGHPPERLQWKPVAPAVLKLDDRPVNNWSLYRAERRTYLLLVVLDNRWLLLDLRTQTVYQADPKRYRHNGRRLLGPGPDGNLPVAETTHWDVSDVGPANQIRFYLPAEGRWLTLQVPHQRPD
jgi:hypothetical protein